MMDCPICDELFLDKNLFLQHIEEHKANSILNKTPEPAQIWKKSPNKRGSTNEPR